MKQVGGLLDAALNRYGMKEQVDSTIIMQHFSDVCLRFIGKHIENQFQPMYVKKKILYVAFLSSAYAHQVMLKKRPIVYELQKKFGKDRIKDIKTVL